MRPFITQPTKLQAPISDLRNCRALIIDSNKVSSSVLRSTLTDLGLTGVTQARKVSEARSALELRQYDVVLCDFHFDDAGITGMDLLDDLRKAQLLPYSTVFVMVTSEASYEKVAEAAEAALDSYLIKPHTANALAQRLHMARHRKVELSGIFEAIEQKQFENAIHLCLKRVKERGEYWLYAARMGGELLMKLARYDDAIKLFQLIDKEKSLPWARLGIARAQLESGQTSPAKQTVDALIAQNPSYTDAYDVLARVQIQGGQFEDALAAYERAVDATPASVSRLQKLGMLAFYLGKSEHAARMLERSATLGLLSKLFDAQSLYTLALIRFDQDDLKGIQRCAAHLSTLLIKDPEHVRLRRLQSLIQTLSLMQQGVFGEASDAVVTMLDEIDAPDFDLEAASNLLCLLVRWRSEEAQLEGCAAKVAQMSTRFCTSKAHSDMLALAANGHEAYVAQIQEAYATILGIAEKAMAHVRQGNMDAAYRTLWVHGLQTHNARLLDLADMLIKRYSDEIPEAATRGQELTALRDQFCRFSTHLQLGANTGREAGGLKLRTS